MQRISDSPVLLSMGCHRRRGAVIAIDMDKARALLEMREQLRVLLARGRCKDISKEEVHALVDEIYEEYR